MKQRLCAMATVVLGCSLVSVAAETLEDVERGLRDLVERHKSWRYRYESEHILDGPRWWEKTSGTVEYERLPGGGYLYRLERKFRSYKKDDQGKEHRMEGEFLAICDGKNIYNYSDINGDKRALRFELNAFPNPCDYPAMFEAQHRNFIVKLLMDEVVDGQPVYVIEAIPHDRGNPGAVRSVSYFSKENGLSVRNVTEDHLGNPTSTASTSDVRIDVEIPRARFEFKPPEGVPIVDANAAAGAGGAATSQPSTAPTGASK